MIDQPRSAQLNSAQQPGKDAALVADLRRISSEHPGGYRMATALVQRTGMEPKAKRVQQLWSQEGLKVPRRQRKRHWLGKERKRHAERMNHVLSYDSVFDKTEDERRLKWLQDRDEYCRELVALEVSGARRRQM